MTVAYSLIITEIGLTIYSLKLFFCCESTALEAFHKSSSCSGSCFCWK